jgi:hypothetical protein
MYKYHKEDHDVCLMIITYQDYFSMIYLADGEWSLNWENLR